MIELTYASFGREPPLDLSGPRHALVWLLCALFVVVFAGATLVINFFSLFTGTLILFLGRPGVEFRFLRVFRKIPVIAFALPTLFGYAIWHQSSAHGFWFMVWPVLAVWVCGAALIALAALWGWWANA